MQCTSWLFITVSVNANATLHRAVAHTGIPNHDAIATAKGAVGGLTLGAAATYAPHKIRVNCVAPGLVSHLLLRDKSPGFAVVFDVLCLHLQS